MCCQLIVKWYEGAMTKLIEPNAEREASCAGLRIGDVAPDFSARSTTGDVRLSDYRGQWLILFSHPADFTPVCRSEEHTSELQSLMRISYAVFCLKKNTNIVITYNTDRIY